MTEESLTSSNNYLINFIILVIYRAVFDFLSFSNEFHLSFLRVATGLPSLLAEAGERVGLTLHVKHAQGWFSLLAQAGAEQGMSTRCLTMFALSLPIVCITGLAAGMCLRALDYSKRRAKEAEEIAEELRFTHEQWDNIVRAVEGVLWQRDASTWNFISISEQAEGFLGYSREAWLNGADVFTQWIHPEDLDRVQMTWRELLPFPKKYQVEFRVLGADGSWRWICENGASLKDQAGILTICGLSKDVTSRMEENEARRMLHRQQLEAAHESGKAEIAKSVLHNVGNVMNSLNVSAKLHMEAIAASRAPNLGRAARLLKENQENLAQFIKGTRQGRRLPEYLITVSEHLEEENRRLYNEAMAMVHHIEHMRDIITLEQVNGRTSAFEEQADIAGLVEQALALEGDILMDNEIVVERNYADVPPQWISRSQFLQVLVNLVSNARHAVCATGVTGTRRISLGIQPPRNGWITISVADNGCGISRTNLARIFTHGFTTRKDGNGFGLHHAALLVEEMGGRLRAESEGEGHGAVFTLELPSRTELPPSATAYPGAATAADIMVKSSLLQHSALIR